MNSWGYVVSGTEKRHFFNCVLTIFAPGFEIGLHGRFQLADDIGFRGVPILTAELGVGVAGNDRRFRYAFSMVVRHPIDLAVEILDRAGLGHVNFAVDLMNAAEAWSELDPPQLVIIIGMK